MKILALLILVFIFELPAFTQEIEGEYVAEKQLYIPKYEVSQVKIVFSTKREKGTTQNITITMDLGIPGLWFPIAASGLSEAYPDTVHLNNVIRSKPMIVKLFDDCIFFNPVFDGENNPKILETNKNYDISSARFYLKEYTIDKSSQNADPSMSLGYSLKKLPTAFLEPFYFRKFEVTNREYREFTSWVLDSIAMELLYRAGFDEFKTVAKDKTGHLNWGIRDKIWKLQDENAIEALSELYIQDAEHFFRKKPVNTKKLIYENTPAYPDTMVWYADYSFNLNQTIPKNYFTNPGYDNYPVVGINWFQAKAFCRWKTKMIQAELDRLKSPYQVIIDLPAEYEREYVLNGFKPNAENKDVSYLNTLHYHADYLKIELGEGILWHKSTDYKKNTYDRTHPADISKVPINSVKHGQKEHLFSDIDKNGISGLQSNVSEWMAENYKENWQPVMEMRHKIYQSIDAELYKQQVLQLDSNKIGIEKYRLLKKNIHDLELVCQSVYPIRYQLEKEFDNLQDKKGKLVCGSNWFDETFERKRIENAKAFISPEKSFATLGFRYVVKLFPKQ